MRVSQQQATVLTLPDSSDKIWVYNKLASRAWKAILSEALVTGDEVSGFAQDSLYDLPGGQYPHKHGTGFQPDLCGGSLYPETSSPDTNNSLCSLC